MPEVANPVTPSDRLEQILAELTGKRPSPALPELSREQRIAVQKINAWLARGTPQTFYLAGYAGTGKTRVIRHYADKLGSSALFAAFAGKAAETMRQRGIEQATTLHSLIYKPWERSEKEMAVLKAKVEQHRKSLATGSGDRQALLKQLRLAEQDFDEAMAPRFVLNRDSPLRDAKLLVLDEVSMVGERLARDLLSFNTPMLVVGDPGQLPPVRGQGFFTNREPDALLEEIHRQAEGSGILRLATAVRNRRAPPFGDYGNDVTIRAKSKIAGGRLNAYLASDDQIVCGYNATRRALNRLLLSIHGFRGVYPTGAGEKLICLKNDHRRGLFNGMPVRLTDVRDEGDPLHFTAEVWTVDESGKPLESRRRAQIYKGHFDDALSFDKDRIRKDAEALRSLVEVDWGYAITAHKAQGSQWKRVLIVDDHYGGSGVNEKRARWLYTAVTRAMEELVIIELRNRAGQET